MNARITVSLPEELLAEVNAAVAAGRATSVSGHVAQALREKSGRESIDDLLVELRTEMGPPTEGEATWVSEVLGSVDE